MTTASQTTKIALDAGTWSNYTDAQPRVYLPTEKVDAKNVWIQLDRDVEDPLYAANDSIIYSAYRCVLQARARNRTDLDNIIKDIKEIFRVSSENLTLSNLKDLSKRTKYIKIMNVKLIN
jgi:hypothetical protein